MEITKTAIECYKLRSKTSTIWADITIDNLENTGRIQIASDFGNWCYYWGSCGESFKKFLTQLDIGYLSNKFGENRWFDIEETISLLKRYINEELPEIDQIYDMEDAVEKANYEKKKQDREEQLKDFDNDFKHLSNASSEQEFVSIWWECNKITKFIERPDLMHRISPLFERFWNEIWLEFVKELEKEIRNEKNIASIEKQNSLEVGS